MKRLTTIILLLICTNVLAGITFQQFSDNAMTSKEYEYLRGEGYIDLDGMPAESLMELLKKMGEVNSPTGDFLHFSGEHQRKLYFKLERLKETDYKLYRKMIVQFQRTGAGVRSYSVPVRR